MATATKAKESSPKEIDDYMLKDEEVSYSFKHRPSGLIPWLKSLLGYGESHWYVTNERLIKYDKIAGGLGFREVPLENITSVEYGRKIDLQALAIGIITLPILIGVLIILATLFRRPQVLELHVSGGSNLSVEISKGTDIEEILWYLPTQRKIDSE
ncbi:PH domain-containing protein [Halorussus salinisoli]|uniref:PH domain-containing protein n=1 Tax=Halorussus salinisoli TaxID=2558242 RepID=UPI0010C22D1D|nr:PH domain-containing protein [Halorussus salinisoli]